MFGLLDAPCRGCSGQRHDAYRGFFCGLSNRLSADYGPTARFLVNRDGAFLSLLTASQMRAEPRSTAATCCNPLARRRQLFQIGEGASFAAAVSLSGLEHKLADDRVDEGRLRSRLAAGFMALASKRFARARASFSDVDFAVDDMRRELAAQEDMEADCRREPSLRGVAEPTGQAFGSICRHTSALSASSETADATFSLGRALGRLTYLRDALMDRRSDDARKRFNPISAVARKEGEERASTQLRDAVASCLDDIRTAVAELRLHRHRSLVEEILLIRLPAKMAGLIGAPELATATAGAGSASIAHFASTEDGNTSQAGGGSTSGFQKCCNCCGCCGCCTSLGLGGCALWCMSQCDGPGCNCSSGNCQGCGDCDCASGGC